MSPASKKKPRWFLYIVECSDFTWYTGITCDIARRLEQHNAGTASRYTRSRLPVKIIFQESCRSKSDALKKEFAIKRMTRKEKGTYIAQTRKKGAKTSGNAQRRRKELSSE